MSSRRRPASIGALICAALISATATVSAREPVVFHGLAFPESVSGFTRGEPNDFEKTSPGLGYGVRYLRSGWTVNVFIYDLRMPSIPEDPLSDVVRQQFDQAKRDIFQAQQNGTYQKVALKAEYNLPNAGRAKFQCASFTLVRQGNADIDSYLCVTAWKKKFVKFRVSTPRGPGTEVEARQFVEAWDKILWP